ncbi:MAG TPA: hypothetical protein VJN18_35675 [Polyangiaceae bacterium]|nr:hypothetical protein [Polyangiaceae bacterium]
MSGICDDLEKAFSLRGGGGAKLIAQVRDMARRDWAVRVLDAWARAHFRSDWLTLDMAAHWTCSLRTGQSAKHFDGTTPDAARLAAAAAVFPELPESVRAELGERP